MIQQVHVIKLEVLKRKSKISPCCFVMVKEEFCVRSTIREEVENNILLSYFLLTKSILKLTFQIQTVTSRFRKGSFTTIQLNSSHKASSVIKQTFCFRWSASLGLGILGAQARGNVWHWYFPKMKDPETSQQTCQVQLMMVLTSLSDPIGCIILLAPNAFCTLSHFTLTTTLSGWFLCPSLSNLSKIVKSVGDRAKIKI